MSADLERKVREAAEQALDKKRSLLEWTDNAYLYGDGYRDGYLAAATLREEGYKEAFLLAAAQANMIGELEFEIATLRARVAELSAKLEAVPVEEMKAIVEWELGLDYPCEASAAIDRWLATETKP